MAKTYQPKKIYQVDTKEYMIFDNKKSFIGNHSHFVNAKSSKDAKNQFTTKYKDGEMVNHYTGKKKVVYDLDNLKVTRKKEYDKLL